MREHLNKKVQRGRGLRNETAVSVTDLKVGPRPKTLIVLIIEFGYEANMGIKRLWIASRDGGKLPLHLPADGRGTREFNTVHPKEDKLYIPHGLAK
ncbi:unnamed protein product [Dovyalis caffra]|uniref:Uncharacterized protein n=1 Tax=Dovyalis caffra TaxID=77055 RepID=A0AAV1S4T6_9ROSI|nr:unnamed protein product [Dovyalis caffra]